MLPRIQILTTGEFLKLSAKGLSIVIRSLMFQEQSDLLGSITYPGTMPLEENAAALQNGHVINSDASLRSFPVRLWLGAIPWKLAKLNYIIKDNEISYTLYLDLASEALKLKSLKLNSLPDDPNYLQLNFSTDSEVIAFMNGTTTAAQGASPVVFFPYKNDGAYKEIDPSDYGSYPEFSLPYDIFFNSWSIDANGNGSFLRDDSAGLAKHTQTPFFYLVYIIKRIIKYLGYTPVGDWLDDENANRIVVASCLPAFISRIFPDFTYFMPDITVADFFAELRSRWGVSLLFDQISNTCYVDAIKYLVKTDNVVDLRGYQMLSFEELSTSLRAYTIKESLDDKDAAFSDTDKDALPVLKIGDVDTAVELTEIQLKSVATKMITENSPVWAQSAAWRIPWIKQPIYGQTPFDQISELPYLDRSKFALRFMYYHGMQRNATGFLYPYGSIDNLDLYGKALTNFSLALNAPAGTDLSVQRYYEFMKNSKPFEMGFALTPRNFLSITPNARVIVRDPVTQASIPCLLDQIGADLGNQETVMAKATLYPILVPVNQYEVRPVVPVITDPPFDNGTVYIKLIKRNETVEYANNPPPPHSSAYADFYIQCFADAAGTVPKDVTRLEVHVKVVINYSAGAGSSAGFDIITCTSTGHEAILYTKAFTGSSSSGTSLSYTYTLATNALYHIIT